MTIQTKVLISVLALGSLVGCMRSPGGISQSTTPIEGRPYTILGEAYGAKTQYHILGVIPTGAANVLQEAVDEAKRASGADALIDVTVEDYYKNFVVFSSTTMEVHGKAIKFTGSR